MSETYNKWSVGDRLNAVDRELLDQEELEEVLAVASHPKPGGFFSDPYAGGYLVIARSSNSIFAVYPDIDGLEIEEERPQFLGVLESERELVEIAANFVLNGDHEAAAAAYFHFNEATCSELNNDFFSAMPEFYWFRCSRQVDDFATQLESILQLRSPLYRHLSAFMSNPNNAEFASTKTAMMRDLSFEWHFSEFKK
jgi:hypothetical protein